MRKKTGKELHAQELAAAFAYRLPGIELQWGKQMSTAKELITELVQKQPDDSSYDEIIRELAFHLMIERGLKDSDENRTISNEEIRQQINNWPK